MVQPRSPCSNFPRKARDGQWKEEGGDGMKERAGAGALPSFGWNPGCGAMWAPFYRDYISNYAYVLWHIVTYRYKVYLRAQVAWTSQCPSSARQEHPAHACSEDRWKNVKKSHKVKKSLTMSVESLWKGEKATKPLSFVFPLLPVVSCVSPWVCANRQQAEAPSLLSASAYCSSEGSVLERTNSKNWP